jgi:hypothetical protein
MPKVPPSSYNPQPLPPPSESNAVPESSNKENTAPGDLQPPQQPQQTSGSPPSSELVPDSQPQPPSPRTNDVLPPPLALLLGSIRSSIQSFFVAKPPHTIQRLAELILRPTAHYKTLPAYLRAVDRVVSVTSGADVFPFSAPPSAGAQSNGLVHPTNSAGAYLTPDYTSGLGSDESLGGALLTPIPWLTNASFEGGDGGIVDERMLLSVPYANTVVELRLTELQKDSQSSSHKRSKLQRQQRPKARMRPKFLSVPHQQTHQRKFLMPGVHQLLV